MPVVVGAPDHSGYGCFPEAIDRDWVGRFCHLSDADLGLARRRAGDVTRLGFAVQLVTVRAIGTFLAEPAAVPAPVAGAVARQLGFDDPGLLAGYGKLAVRWKHTGEIRRRYGYGDFTSQPANFLLGLWLYRQAWADDLGPSSLFRAAHRRMLAERILLPGAHVLGRLVASIRERATGRFWGDLAVRASAELRSRLESLLVVPEGERRSELDRLRRPPFSPSITGLIQALERFAEVRALGVGDLDLSGLPPRRVAMLARYAEDAWVTQLADLTAERKMATLIAFTHVLTSSARDDVIDIFDVVFGDLQRSATHRGQKRRAGELREYDQAVGELHARMQGLLDALDDGDEAITTALGRLRDERGRIEEVLTRVTALMRPPADPFHERLVASYPQIRRFLPALIDAIAFDSTTAARPVLDAYHALGRWLTERPHATRLPSTEVPLDVVHASWEPHVRPTGAGTVNRAAYACCVLDQLRTGLRRRDVYAPASIRWGDPRAELLPPRPGTSSGSGHARTSPWTPIPAASSPSSPAPSTTPGDAPPLGCPATPTSASSDVRATTGSW